MINRPKYLTFVYNLICLFLVIALHGG